MSKLLGERGSGEEKTRVKEVKDNGDILHLRREV